ncbi:MAG: hypothetical protein U9P90_01710 [Patescibacteria group bacterium]|nr:hypothetical protein [Patescibacteria group bacterium]
MISILPTADIDNLKSLVQLFREKRVLRDEGIELFFFLALVGYYDCMWDGMDDTVGHLLYRLSDIVEPIERQQMEIYPSCGGEGSLILDDGGCWHSLEDWRRAWEKYFPEGIPEVFHLLPSHEDGAELEEMFIELAE